MFWGLIVRHDKQYSHKVENRFHISMASLDVSTAGKNPLDLMVKVDEESYMLCRLSKENVQQPLDLNFSEGEEIVLFSKNGEGNIHLTGYNLEDEMDFEEGSDEEVEEEEENEKMDTPKSQSKKRKPEVVVPDASKKMKTESPAKKKAAATEESDSDEEDSDLDLSDLDDEEMDEMFDEEASEEEESEMSEEETITPVKKGKTPQKPTPAPQTGSGKKNKKQKTPAVTPQSLVKEQAPKYLGTPYPGKGQESKPETPMTNGTETEKKKKKKNKNKKKDSMGASPSLEQPKSQKKFIKGGIGLEDMKVGTGPDAAKGKFVQIYYEGKLKDSGKVFDSNKEGKGFKFKLGAGEVIKGMEFGLDGMKVGGRRKLTIPPKMGYGHQGAGKDIPPNSTLVFDIELKAVN